MQHVDCQDIESGNCRIHADASRTGAGNNRMGAEKKTIINNIVTINLQAVVIADRQYYNNGTFIPVFQREILAIVARKEVQHSTIRVLFALMGLANENNEISLKLKDLALLINTSEDTVYRAVKQLIAMRILCRREGSPNSSTYELSSKMINPRIAYRGNTRTLAKERLPQLLAPDGETPLIPAYEAPTPDF